MCPRTRRNAATPRCTLSLAPHLARRLSVAHGSDQPVLLVNDLKLGENRGAIALWIGPGTEGYFANAAVTKPPE